MSDLVAFANLAGPLWIVRVSLATDRTGRTGRARRGACGKPIMIEVEHRTLFEEHIAGLRVRGHQGYGQCPFHEDHKASFSVDLNTGLWTCHAGCGTGNAHQFAERLGLQTSLPTSAERKIRVIATYVYTDEQGAPLHRTRRLDPKGFYQERFDGRQWVPGLKGTRLVPYNLQAIHSAIARNERIFIVEGEKDVETLRKHRVVATTNPMGAGKWHDDYAAFFKGARCTVLPDNDPAGAHHAQQVAETLHGVAGEVKVLPLPGLPPKGDVSDWLAAGHTAEDLARLADQAQPWRPPAEKNPSEEASFIRLTDLGNAQRLVRHHGHDFRYVQMWRAWLAWDGCRWREDATGEVKRRAKATVINMYAEAATISDEKARKDLAAHAERSEAEARLRAMITLAESEREVAVEPNQLDADPYLLTCVNGTIDLRTGSLQPHRREDLVTKLAPVKFDPDARLDLWDQTLAFAFPDPDIRAFVQRAQGYSITGDTKEEKFFMSIGPTGAAKSTIGEAIKAALGDYAATADFESFLFRRDGRGPRNDIARLAGTRFVISVEVDRGRRIAEGLVKLLTGGDTVVARRLYQELFEFVPRFKLWLVSNDPPIVRDDDDALWRRIIRIPFAQIPEDRRDPNVKALLRDPATAGPAILAWLVQGCLNWQRQGLGVPEAITEVTRAYREEMDPLKPFIEGTCILDPTTWVAAAKLREAYETWCRENGERPVAGRAWGQRLRDRGCCPEKHGARGWTGIALKDGGVD